MNNKKKFYSVKESRRAFMMVCQTEAEYRQLYDNKVEGEGSVPPYISLIGSVQEPQYFMVDFENITYKFFKFSKALEICFKSYFLFNLAFPEACDCIWEFINKQFFKIEIDSYQAKPTLDALMRDIYCKYTAFSYNQFMYRVILWEFYFTIILVALESSNDC